MKNWISVAECLQFFCIRTHEKAFNQLFEGLSILDVLKTLRKHPKLMETLFLRENQALTVDRFLQIFKISRSEAESAEFEREKNVLTLFFAMLSSIESKYKVNNNFS